MKAAATALCALFIASTATAQVANLQTTPERTRFEETSTHADVMAFLRAIDAASDLIHLETMGTSNEGRPIPLAVVGRNLRNGSPEAVRATGKLRVYLQGNIHGGEVEGKEVLQMLLRDIAQGQHGSWLDSMVLLIAPIYNADGNDKFGVRNRGRQHGPVKGMGQRPNAQGLDLNRDHMKLESPEARGLVSMLTRYDPQVAVDLHTTDGTIHAYHLTYSPPLHPGTDTRITSILRDQWLPQLTNNVRSKSGWEYYYYGNIEGRDTARTWATFDHRPRFNNNYAGLRNRFGILSEAYSYATFEDRITATRYFVDEVLDFARANAPLIRRTVEQLDQQSIVGTSLPVRSTFERAPKKVEILLGEVIREANPFSGDTIWRRADVKKPESMWEAGTFKGTAFRAAPEAYYIPPQVVASPAMRVLEQHGITTRTLSRDTTITVEQFRIDSTSIAPRPFQGHQERTLWGDYENATVKMPAGTIVIDVAQPLGRLVFFLIEPESDDGLVTWNYFDSLIEGKKHYPIVRAR